MTKHPFTASSASDSKVVAGPSESKLVITRLPDRRRAVKPWRYHAASLSASGPVVATVTIKTTAGVTSSHGTSTANLINRFQQLVQLI